VAEDRVIRIEFQVLRAGESRSVMIIQVDGPSENGLVYAPPPPAWLDRASYGVASITRTKLPVEAASLRPFLDGLIGQTGLDPYWNVYRDGPFTPDWQSDTLSVIYRYTSNQPELLPMPDVGTFIQANLDSEGYERMPDGSWGLKGHMFVQTRFP
jgi:hypothetical protein